MSVFDAPDGGNSLLKTLWEKGGNQHFLMRKQTKLLKTLWEEGKMLESSIFSFAHNVLYPMKVIFNVLNNIQFSICKCFQFGQG